MVHRSGVGSMGYGLGGLAQLRETVPCGYAVVVIWKLAKFVDTTYLAGTQLRRRLTFSIACKVAIYMWQQTTCLIQMCCFHNKVLGLQSAIHNAWDDGSEAHNWWPRHRVLHISWLCFFLGINRH